MPLVALTVMHNQLASQPTDAAPSAPRSRRLAYAAAAILAAITPGIVFGHPGLFVMIAVAVVLSFAAIAIQSEHLGRQRGRFSRWRQRHRRESRRLSLLCPLSRAREQEYCELGYLVEHYVDDIDAARFELQGGLLDHFVRTAVAHKRCLDALKLAADLSTADPPRVKRLDDGSYVRLADDRSTAGDASVASASAVRSKRRREIRERRIRHRDACREERVQLAEDLTVICELLRLIVQRIQRPTIDSDGGELGRLGQRDRGAATGQRRCWRSHARNHRERRNSVMGSSLIARREFEPDGVAIVFPGIGLWSRR